MLNFKFDLIDIDSAYFDNLKSALYKEEFEKILFMNR